MTTRAEAQPWAVTFPEERGTSELAERIEGYIARRACGRIRDLRVTCSAERIELRGRSRTYHAKQLAQEAALDLAGGRQLLTNLIEVG